MMKRFSILLSVLGILVLCPPMFAQDPTPPETSASSETPPAKTQPAKSEETELPSGPPGLLAKVGKVEIKRQDLMTILDKIPYRLSPKKRKEVWESNLAQAIYSQLLHSYLEVTKAPEAPDELAAIKEQLTTEVERYNKTASMRLRPETTTFQMMESRGLTEQKLEDQARFQKLISSITTNEQLLAFMNKNPDYINGTQVEIGHILIPCASLAPSSEQKAVVEKLNQLAADIRAEKTTFAQAAHEHSLCPSGKVKGHDGKGEYGDLGRLTFPQLAYVAGVPLAVAVFHADVGGLSAVVRSPQGFHLLKIKERIKGDQPHTAESAGIAQMAVTSLVENQIINQSLGAAPIVIYKESKKIPKPKRD